MRGVRDLGRQLGGGDNLGLEPAHIRQAVVQSVQGDTVTIALGGSGKTIDGVPYLPGYAPDPGDTVWAQVSEGNVIVQGDVGDSQHGYSYMWTWNNKTIANTTVTQVTMESCRTFGPHTSHDLTNDRISILTEGMYLIGTNTGWASNSTGRRYVSIRANDGDNLASHRVPAALETETSFSKLLPLSAGEYIELTVWQSSGGPLDLDGGWNDRITASLWAMKLTTPWAV